MIRILALAVLFACRNTPPPSPVIATPAPDAPPTAPTPPPPPTPPTDPTLDARLAALAVSDDDYYRPILYSWTTPAAIAELRASRTLLVATTTTGGFVSPFNRALGVLAVTARPGADIAKILRDDRRLARRRYAWPAPFATVLGVGPRAYGNALIRIELRPDAWIGRFSPADPDPFRFVDGAGHRITYADVAASPERIGAIFHVREEAAVPYREYVVCNPSMVAAWSVATPEIHAELAAELDLVRALRTLAISDATTPAVAAWTVRHASSTLDRWHAALAFDTERYRPLARELAHLAKALAAYDPAGAAVYSGSTAP